MKRFQYSVLLLLLATMFAVLPAGAAGPNKDIRKPQSTQGAPAFTYMDINNISTVFRNDGVSDIDAQQLNSGFVFPKGSGKTAAFQSGFLWGGLVSGAVRVGGSSYNTGLQPGKIVGGVAESPDLAKNRIYRVRPDYKTADLSAQAKNEGVDVSALYSQLDADYNEWPVADGAPTYKNDAGQTVPGVKGADLTIWYVANDLNAANTQHLYGSAPIGLELQVTIWGYAQQGALGNMLFRRYLLINKGTNNVDSMYVSQWSDIDDGNATDDFAGCDTNLSLGYVYNANASDATYDPLPPPAVGFDFFQGPIVNGAPGDQAIFRGSKINGKKNLPMTAFYYFARGDANVTDPTLQDYQGSLQFYNFFRGRVGKSGNSFVDPNTGIPTSFALAGDPASHKGWVDGQLLPAGDRRIGLASGPFQMAPGDSQEIVVAEIAAGAIPGVDRISAIGLLKFYDQQAQLAYDNFFDLPSPPPAPSVTVTELDHEVLLTWGNDLNAVNATESFNQKGYSFEGYNVYQLPSASATIDQAKRIATFDLVNGVGKIKDYVFDPNAGDVLQTVSQFGNDVGIKRYLDIKVDEQGSGGQLTNGKKYYYAVTSYNYNPSPTAVPNNKENPLAVFTATPHSINPGFDFSSTAVKYYSNVTHATGIGDATVFYKVIDPSLLTGANYSVQFAAQPDKFTAAYTVPDSALTIGEVTLTGALQLNSAGTSASYSLTLTNTDSLTGAVTSAEIVDETGATVKTFSLSYATVLGKKVATASAVWTSTDATRPLTPALVTKLIAGNLKFAIKTATNPTGEVTAPFAISTYPWTLSRGSTKILDYQQNYSLDSAYAIVDGMQVVVGNLTFAAPFTFLNTEQTVNTNPANGSMTLWGDGYTIFGNATGLASDNFGGGGSATQTDLVQDLEFRFTGVPADTAHPLESAIVSGGSIATVRSRSAAGATKRIRIPFELWEVERNRQINVSITDRNADGTSPWGDTGTPQWFRIRGRDYIVPIATPYDPDTAFAKTATLSRTAPNSTWFIFFDGGEGGHASTWHTGDKYVVRYGNNIIPGNTATSDVYTFTAPKAVSYSDSKAQDDIKRINVFPNPYYGVNAAELNKYQKFVTFSHLPAKATIRIFNLAGVLVRTISKDEPSQFQRWDLANESGLPVASGLYIAHIDMGSLGTKTLKFTIIQERQFLDRF